MARRKDHTPEELKQLIIQEAENIIYTKGLNKLTARALANAVGYTPGTIYNFYKDMDAVIQDINYETLGRLHSLCLEKIKDLPLKIAKIKALAYAYVDFAHHNARAWEALFATTRKDEKRGRLPKQYQQRLAQLFQIIEDTLRECFVISDDEAAKTARLLWACLHGITVLTLDGRLQLIGVDEPHQMIDVLLQRYLAVYL